MCIKYFVSVCCREAAEFVYEWMIGRTQDSCQNSELEAVDFFSGVSEDALSLSLTASLETWVNNQPDKRRENQQSSHPPTLTIHFYQCGLVGVRLFHSKRLKPELLVDPFSNAASILILVKK